MTTIKNADFRRVLSTLFEDQEHLYGNLYDAASTGPGVLTEYGRLTAVESGVVLDKYGEKSDFEVYKLGDQYFRVDGWSDSWGSGEMYYSQAYEVVQRPVTRYEYLAKSEGDQID